MRTLLVLATALLISQFGFAQGGPPGGGGRGGRGGGGGGGRGQAAPPPAPQDPGFECFQSVPTPEFPDAALRAHVDGTVYIWAHLTAQSTVEKVDTQVASAWADGPKLLTPPVEKAVRAAMFKPECAGKTVAVVYRYELRGEPTASPKVTTKIEQPNIMFLDSQPQMASAGRGAAATKK